MKPEVVRAAFHEQGIACASLGSPFMARLCALFGSRDWPEGRVRDKVFGWSGDLSPRAQSVPLRLCGGLHALKLKGDVTLTAAYPPQDVSDDTLWQAVCKVMVAQEAFLTTWMASPPQTNEVRRCVTLIPVGHYLHERFGLPIRLSELGASGGLNLMFDRFALNIDGQVFGPPHPAARLTPDWSGPLPPAQEPTIAAREGVDLNPLDPHDPEDALRLQAYLWADQPERMALTLAAIKVANAPVTRADAIDWLAKRLDHAPGQAHLIYSTVAWQYFPAEKQVLGTSLISAAGAKATEDAPLAWFGMENDGGARGAALTLRIWPGNETKDLGRADFHGRWVEWKDE
ncbi:hypothetical protein SAMN04488515_2375 [Cognatiyoonia koreensis]|uniref:DUF2332 domain-containing protein n=1 Tax=Cognatiyoonia koreensis TaxID=364200 RepID=A0A1I0RBI0_9RHOB|nr:DUF2332 family protein [Cognatiyoonia koreensis]SEW37606.1 hypothetical protein SAMN04488515_2375 [Cognatiyoonia koreensis]